MTKVDNPRCCQFDSGLRSETGPRSRGESEGVRERKERGREGREWVCVTDVREPHANHLNDAETGRGDADCDGYSWLQRHGWGIRNGRNEKLTAVARRQREKGKLGCIFIN